MEAVRELNLRFGKTKKISSFVDYSINSPMTCYRIMKPLFDKNTIEYNESFHVLFLNNGLKMLGHCKVSDGGLSSVLIDVRVIFSRALLVGATHIIVAHNHPSGDKNPSDNDLQLTQKIIDGGKLLDIKLLDHIIITKDSFTSIKEDGYCSW